MMDEQTFEWVKRYIRDYLAEHNGGFLKYVELSRITEVPYPQDTLEKEPRQDEFQW